MKQIVYVDVLIILNLFINLSLLLITSYFLKIKKNNLRLFLASLFGGLYSLIIFLPEMNFILDFFSKTAISFLIVLIAFGYKTFSRFIKCSVCFTGFTFLFAGMTVAMWFIFKPGGMYYRNSTVYFDINFFILVISTAVCYIITRLFVKFINRNKPQSFIYNFSVTLSGKTLSGRGMIDTGNTLSDGFSGYPVVIGTVNFFKKILPEEYISLFENKNNFNFTFDETHKNFFRLIPCSTVSGESILPCFRPEKLTVYNSKERIETDKVFIALTDKKKNINEDFDLLLNPNLF